MMLLQRRAPDGTRQVIAAIEGAYRVLPGYQSTLELAHAAIERGCSLADVAGSCESMVMLPPEALLFEPLFE